MNDSFTPDLRQAHRIVAAYSRRVLDAMAYVGDKLAEKDLSFQKWLPQYNNPVPEGRNSSWARRWAWDFLPLHSVAGWWIRGAGDRKPGTLHVVVEHIVDTAFETWAIDGRSGEPDPLEFSSDADTVWRGRLLLNPLNGTAISADLWEKNWCDVFAFVAGSSGRYPAAGGGGGVLRGEHEGLKTSQFSVSVDSLATPDDFTRDFVNVLLTEVDRIGA